MAITPGEPVGYDGAADLPPDRPPNLRALPFRPLPAVQWFRPGVLAAAALQVMMSRAFGAWLDKRELQQVLDQEPFTGFADRPELWVDFVADTGDGFDATYTVACAVGRTQLDVVGLDRPLPRADVIVFGGDLVYPDATANGYEDRFAGPFGAALPWTPPGRRPALFALPGNHDWYDGLTSFTRVFGQQKAIGGWQTFQTRSYFAVQLPHRWWLWGVDVAFDAYIDEPQLRFFQGVGLRPGDRVILCAAEPSWVGTAADPAAYRNLAYVERRVISPAGAEATVALSGDLHHYARYEADAGRLQKITAGGGGAFLHPTHRLPLRLPLRTDPDDPATVRPHTLATTYPATARSRWLALGALTLPLRNPTFPIVPGVVYLLLSTLVLAGLRARADEAAAAGAASDAGARLAELLDGLTYGATLARMFTEPVAIGLVVLVLLALVAFAKPPRHLGPRAVWVAKRVMGPVHAGLHVVTAGLVAWAALQVAAGVRPGWPTTATVTLVSFVLGGLAGSVALGVYLTVASIVFGAEGNHAFSAQRRTGYKNFLRLHVRRDGALDVYAIGIDRAGRRWETTPGGDDEPWLEARRPPAAPRLVDTVTLAAPPPGETG